MALDTTIGGAASDSYVTLAEFQTYWLLRGVDVSQHGHDASHEANLRRAADALTRRWAYIGYRVTKAQALAFPRVIDRLVDGWSVASDEIPTAIKSAQCELAYLIHEGLDPFATVMGGAVAAESASAGPVSTSKTYAAPRETPRLVSVEGLLAPYLGAASGQVRLGRA